MGNRITRTIILLCFTVSCCTFMYRAWLALSEHRQLEYGEGPIVDQVERLARGENIYRPDLSQPPFVISNYPPVFHLAQLPIRNLLGPGFLAGRLVSTIATLLTCFCLYVLARRLRASRLNSIAAVVLFASSPFILEWGVLNRVDPLALLFSVVALLLALHRPGNVRWIIAAAIASSFAMFTRQTYAISTPLFLTLFYWLSSNRKGALYYAVITLCCSGLGAIALMYYSHGGAFFHLVIANMNETNLSRASFAFFTLISLSPLQLIAPLLLVLVLRTSTIDLQKRDGRFTLLLTLIAFIPAIAVAKVGSSVNYFYELTFASALCFALGCQVTASRRYAIALPLLLAVQTTMHVASVYRREILNFDVLRDIGYFSSWDRLEGLSGPILSDEFMGVEPIKGKPLLFQPFEMTQLARAGAWSQEPLLQQIKERYFECIVIRLRPISIRDERWTPEMLQAIGTNYHRAPTDDGALFAEYYRPFGPSSHRPISR